MSGWGEDLCAGALRGMIEIVCISLKDVHSHFEFYSFLETFACVRFTSFGAGDEPQGSEKHKLKLPLFLNFMYLPSLVCSFAVRLEPFAS